MKTLEQDLLKELLNYDPDTGIFTWRKQASNNVKIGEVAGWEDAGYIRIELNYKAYRAHRLAWIYMYGSITKGIQIDHINGVKDDNRIENLRLATYGEQTQNRKVREDNTSGFVGVNWHKATGKWQARIGVNGVRLRLGYFNTPEAANDARIKAKAELHTFNPIQRTS